MRLGLNTHARTAHTKPNTDTDLKPDVLPTHVGIIMDGNGRWAKAHNLPRLAGHRAGAENIRRIVECALEYQLSYLTLYAFSTENWRRPRAEIDGLLGVLGEVIERETPRLRDDGVRVCHLGKLDRLPPSLIGAIQDALITTRQNTRLVLNVCFDYGGRAEILDAVRQIVSAGIAPDQIDEHLIDQYLYSYGSPDPDLIIRTANEQRLSNFLVWQAAYSEYWFAPCYWPDFGPEEFRQALVAYSRRLRKFGMTPEQIAQTPR